MDNFCFLNQNKIENIRKKNLEFKYKINSLLSVDGETIKVLAEKDLKSLQISVKTYNGAVILSGFVDDEISKLKAETIVSKIDGVKSVKNSLVVKS